MTAKMMATKPTSILPLIKPIEELPGIRIFNRGKISTMTIMAIMRVSVCFCFLSNDSGFLNVTPFPILRFDLKPKRKIVINISENRMAKRKICISIPKVSTAVSSGADSYALSARPRKMTPRLEVGKLPPARAPALMATAPVSLSMRDSSHITKVMGARKARTVKNVAPMTERMTATAKSA